MISKKELYNLLKRIGDAMSKLHKSLQKILDEINSEKSIEDHNDDIERIIRSHLEKALKNAGEEIEATYRLNEVVVSVQIREVCVYSKKN